jgi:hypothetical protein
MQHPSSERQLPSGSPFVGWVLGEPNQRSALPPGRPFRCLGARHGATPRQRQGGTPRLATPRLATPRHGQSLRWFTAHPGLRQGDYDVPARGPYRIDDFRYGMALNPHMKAFITHGRYDLVTPFYTTDRLYNLMRLDSEPASRLTVKHFGGGHMFYAWEDSRRAFTVAIEQFYAAAVPGSGQSS